MLTNKVCIFIVATTFLIGVITGACFLGKITTVKNPEYTAFTTILKEVQTDDKKNVHFLKRMYDEKKNLAWIEFYDTESYLSSLWLGFVVIDLTTCEVVHTETDVQLYSGISPEMAKYFRLGKTELHNDYGDFSINNFN